MDDGVVAALERALPERLTALQRASGVPVVFGGSTRPASPGRQRPAAGEDHCPGPGTPLDELADIIRQTPDSALRARLTRVYRQLGGRLDGEAEPPPAPGPRLPPRELDVLRLAAFGATNLEIAGRLRLSPETVKSYLQSAMRRLGVRNRTAAVHAACESGLL